MAITDPISDFLTCVRNACRSRKEAVTVPGSQMKVELANILKEEGFITNFKVVEEKNKKFIRLSLKYLKSGKSAIRNIRRVSKPGLRYYVESTNIPRVLNGLGVVVLSTSKGVITGERARELKIGGEVLCKVW